MISKIPTNLPPHLSLKFIQKYTSSGDLQRARQLFDTIPEPDLRSWTVLIDAYTKNGYPKEALNLHAVFCKRNIQPDKLLLLSAAKACAASKDINKAQAIHHDAMKFGYGSDLLLCNSLIDMYGKCRYLGGAVDVFAHMPVKDVISWTSLVSCYVNCGLPRDALRTFREMGLNRVKPNSFTLACVLPACSELKDLKCGREIHGFVVRNGLGDNVFVNNSLVNVYASCLSIKQARLVFETTSQRDTPSWNGLLTAYFSNKDCEKALSLFKQMRTAGVGLDYASWNAVIGGCIQNGRTQDALGMLEQMQVSGFRPNQITVCTLIPVCTTLENLTGGKEIHGYVFRHWFWEDVTTATAMILLYAKCGNMEFADRVFSMMPVKDTIAWSTMIFANSMHGNGEEALSLFRRMLNSGVKPNAMTFTGVLSGCSHSRLVDEALSIFRSMSEDHSIKPDAEHYSCMVDVISRAGRLEEAYKFIQEMPIEPTASSWGALLGACRVYKNVDFARLASKKLFEIEPDNPGNYVLLSNIFVAARHWGEASETRKLMEDRGITKMPGCSWVQVANKVHMFVAGDTSNCQKEEIYRYLDELGEKMRLAGYKPNTEFVLQDVDQEEKEDLLGTHSEKLAVAFGLLNLNGASQLRVFKNLRICGDCHNAIKFIAKIVGVKIVVRDSLRFHHFSNGHCSCRDFW